MSLFESKRNSVPPPRLSAEEHLAHIHSRLDEIAETARKGAKDLSFLAGLAALFALLTLFGFLVTFCGALGDIAP